MKEWFSNAILMIIGAAIGGTIAGVATYYFTIQQHLDPSGTYEWQWSQESWYGRITLSDLNRRIISNGRIGHLTKDNSNFIIDEEIMKLKNGNYSVKSNGDVVINMEVRKKVSGSISHVTQKIKGTLKRTNCLAGRITYEDPITNLSYEGDMILVEYLSHLGDKVTKWCLTNE